LKPKETMINYIELWCRHGATLDNPLFVESETCNKRVSIGTHGLNTFHTNPRTMVFRLLLI